MSSADAPPAEPQQRAERRTLPVSRKRRGTDEAAQKQANCDFDAGPDDPYVLGAYSGPESRRYLSHTCPGCDSPARQTEIVRVSESVTTSSVCVRACSGGLPRWPTRPLPAARRAPC